MFHYLFMVDDYACNFSGLQFTKTKPFLNKEYNLGFYYMEAGVSHFDHHYFFPEGVEGTMPEDMASLLKASLGL